MNRGMCFTLVLMLGSVAAAVASPAAQWPQTHEVDAAMVMLGGDEAPLAESHPACTDAGTAAPYLQWHHGSAKLLPACLAAQH